MAAGRGADRRGADQRAAGAAGSGAGSAAGRPSWCSWFRFMFATILWFLAKPATPKADDDDVDDNVDNDDDVGGDDDVDDDVDEDDADDNKDRRRRRPTDVGDVDDVDVFLPALCLHKYVGTSRSLQRLPGPPWSLPWAAIYFYPCIAKALRPIPPTLESLLRRPV